MTAAEADLKTFMQRMTEISQGKQDVPNPLEKYNTQLSDYGVKLADKLLTVPMQEVAKRAAALDNFSLKTGALLKGAGK